MGFPQIKNINIIVSKKFILYNMNQPLGSSDVSKENEAFCELSALVLESCSRTSQITIHDHIENRAVDNINCNHIIVTK